MANRPQKKRPFQKEIVRHFNPKKPVASRVYAGRAADIQEDGEVFAAVSPIAGWVRTLQVNIETMKPESTLASLAAIGENRHSNWTFSVGKGETILHPDFRVESGEKILVLLDVTSEAKGIRVEFDLTE